MKFIKGGKFMYLLGYDISDTKRLAKIYKKLCQYATPIQYSIFLYDGPKKRLLECIDEVLSIMHKKEDDFRVFQLPEQGIQWRLGKSFLPEGIYWTGLPAGLKN